MTKRKSKTTRYRQLITGKRVKDHKLCVTMGVNTHSPEKWRFVDLETGEVWMGRPNNPQSLTLDCYVIAWPPYPRRS